MRSFSFWVSVMHECSAVHQSVSSLPSILSSNQTHVVCEQFDYREGLKQVCRRFSAKHCLRGVGVGENELP